MRFTGNIDAKMDGKGRVFLPAAFRKILLREEIEGLILRRDIFQQCLVLYPENVWNEQVDKVARRASHFDRNGRAALRGFVAGAESITIDGNGRILIPRRYCDAVGLGRLWLRAWSCSWLTMQKLDLILILPIYELRLLPYTRDAA